MILQERKKDFDVKVAEYVNKNITVNHVDKPSLEHFYEMYLKHTYKEELKDFSYNINRDYVQVNFNQTKTENGKNN